MKRKSAFVRVSAGCLIPSWCWKSRRPLCRAPAAAFPE
ncbi:hypothetical protein RHECNPAF_750050 [Rhizobium etli CNPAF512]|nr:hypothetical protein RHECNPAF_750050 [Rhizobium etli CNPAF512]